MVDCATALYTPALHIYMHYQSYVGRPDVDSGTTRCEDGMRNTYVEGLLICCVELVNIFAIQCVVTRDTKLYGMRLEKYSLRQYTVLLRYYQACS